ncbi:MAG: undecaprenyl-phosphate glucose phosphotransferase [Candidatus Azobacteroides sp.]|nr:undecaprenyl-phosphate glucose phosphotransferase [Candidatus Azobacteroides sp.]
MKKHRGRGFLIKWIILFCDMIVMNGVFFIIYHWAGVSDVSFFSTKLKTVILLLNFCYFFTLYFTSIQIYKPIVHVDKIMQRALSTISLHAILFITCLFSLYIDIFSIQFLVAYYVAFYVAFTCWRIFARKTLAFYRKAGYNYKTIVIVGAGKSGLKLYEELNNDQSAGYRVLGFFDENQLSNIPSDTLLLGTISELETFVVENDIDEIYCALPSSQHNVIVKIMNFCEKNMLQFFLVPEYSHYIKKSLMLGSIGAIPILSIRPEPLQYIHNRILKRSWDIVFSLIILVTVFPILFIIVAPMIKLTSPGPVFFKQLRTGIYGKEFGCYKFRTMKVNRDSDLKQATKDDFRITKIGAFLRKTNLDEMPQFFNVLKGEMSVVGPRPHMLSHTKLYSSLIDKFMVRHSIRPGITGWAQITGYRGEISEIEQMEERVKRDVWYIENWNFFFDLKIIALTALSMLKRERENAY